MILHFQRTASHGALAICICSLAAAMGTAPAVADTAAEASQAASPGAQQFDEAIVVTAQRREERLVDVPMTVTSLSGDALAAANVVDTRDLTQVAPGVNFVTNGGYTSITMRGIGSFQRSPGSQNNIAMYLDGSYLPSKLAGIFDLPDIGSVEVLKGPQGTLWGLNATAGAVLVNTLEPSFESRGNVTVGYGSLDHKYGRFFVTGPLVDERLAVSLSGAFQDRDGYMTNVVSGEKQGGVNSKLVRAKLKYTPADNAQFILSGMYSKRKDEDVVLYSFGPGRTAGSSGFRTHPTAITTYDVRKFASRLTDAYLTNESMRISLQSSIDTGAGLLTTATAYTDSDSPSYVDGTFTSAAAVFYRMEQPNKTFSQEITFASERTGVAQFLLGASYIWDKAGFQPLDVYFGPLTATAPILVIDYKVTDRAVSGFAEVDLELSDRLNIILGARYTDIENKYYGSNVTDFYPFVAKKSWGRLTPRAAIRYELSDQTNVYATYSRGFKGGSFAHSSFATTPIDPEIVDGFEIGLKSNPNRMLSLAVSGFYQKFKDMQVEVLAPNELSPGNYLTLTTNAGGAEVYGVDLDVTFRPIPDLTLSAKGEYLHSKYLNFRNANVQFPVPLASCPAASLPVGCGRAGVPTNVSGNDLKNAPKWAGTFSADYVIRSGIGDISLNANVYATSKFFWEFGNLYKEPGYTLINARVSWAPFNNENLSLAVWGKNLGDSDYAMGWNESVGGFIWATGRTVGVEATFGF